MLRILVIDDEAVICDACRMVLTEQGHEVDLCMSGRAGMEALERKEYDLLLLDMKLKDVDGMDILKRIKDQKSGLRVVVMTGYAVVANAVEAMKLGAIDYLAKPFTDDELIEAIQKACTKP